jgi:DNA-binding MarR family transcriptional regulator
MKKTSDKKQPHRDEIARVAKQIESFEFLNCMYFADTLIRYIEIVMKKDVVSRLQGQALRYLIISGNNMTPTRLAKLMYRSKHSMTKIIDNLEKQGLVVRDHTGKDRRVTNIKITSSGLDYVVKTYTSGEAWGQKLLSCLSPQEQKKFISMTKVMRENIVDIMRDFK